MNLEISATATWESRLARRARDLPSGQRAALTALLEDHELLARPGIRDLLVDDDPNTGAITCDWERLQRHIHSPAITSSERAFLQLLLSLACYPNVHLGTTFTKISTRRRAIVLRALTSAAEPPKES